ncbi:hypothetical protein [Verrucomicrobium spinosum]|nr:hypothetical protein [Verrucomicrobium spinosum]
MTQQNETATKERPDLPFDFKGTTPSDLLVSPVVGPEEFALDINIKSENRNASKAVTTSVTIWDKQTVVMGRLMPGADGDAQSQLSEVVLLSFEAVK